MANNKKSPDEATRHVSVTLKTRTVAKLDELFPDDRSAAVEMAIESFIFEVTSNTIEGIERHISEATAKRDAIDINIRELTDKLASLKAEKEQQAIIKSIHDKNDYKAAVREKAISYVDMERSGTLDEENKLSLAQPIADAFKMPLELVLEDITIVAADNTFRNQIAIRHRPRVSYRYM